MKTLILLATFGALAAPAQTLTTLIDHGPPSNRVDLVVFSEGYTASEMDKFAADAKTFMST